MTEKPAVKNYADQTIMAASAEAKNLLNETFQRLKECAAVKNGEKPRFFFPNGVELVYVNINAGLTEKIKVVVEIKIAGEKGVKTLEQEAKVE